MITLSLIDITPGLFFWSLLAFLILLFVLRKFAWKPILDTIHEREMGIADAIASADKVKKEMAQMQAENEKLMQVAREEKAQMLKEAREMKDKIVADAKAQATVEANKIMQDNVLQIQNQKMAALTEVKNEVGKLVMEVSEKVLRKQMENPTNQMDYINQLTKEIKLN